MTSPMHRSGFPARLLQGAFLALLRAIVRPHPPRVAPADTEFKKILVVRQHNQLGDMLCVTPLLRSLRVRYPAANLTLLASPVNHEIMLHHAALNRVINFDKREFLAPWRVHPIKLFRFLQLLRREEFDLVLVPSTVSTSGTSDFIAYVTGAGVRIGAGSLEGTPNTSSYLLSHALDLSWDADRHQTGRNLDCAGPLALPDTEGEITMTLLTVERLWGTEYVREAAHEHRFAVAYHVGAGKPPNRWQADSFAEVISTIGNEFGALPILVCGPMDEVAIQAVESRLSIKYHLVTNQSVRRVASIISALPLLVSNDTGIMHVGAAVGTPVLSLFGPTSPQQWAPLGARNRYIYGEGGSMSAISIDAVLQSIRSMLRERGEGLPERVS